MPSICDIQLNKSTPVYYAGQDTVDGEIILRTAKFKNIKCIKIRFKGGTKCGYTKNILTGKPNNKNLTYYTSKQTLTKIEHVVMGPGILRPDFYKFSFSFPIDRFCPTSIEGIAGHIRYQVSLKIIHYNNYKNCYYKPVTVIQTNDLNDWLKIIMEPNRANNLSEQCYCSAFKKPEFGVAIFHGAYAAGQWAKYCMQVINKDTKRVYRYNMYFVRQTKYIAVKPRAYNLLEETVLSHVTRDGNGQKDEYFEYSFHVPCTPPSTETKYLILGYIFRVVVKADCCRNYSQLELEVPVGTIPCLKTLTPAQTERLVRMQGRRAIITPTRHQPAEPKSRTFIDRLTIEKNRNDNFVPLYPVYRIV